MTINSIREVYETGSSRKGPEDKFIRKHLMKVSDPSGLATPNKENTETTKKVEHKNTPDTAYESYIETNYDRLINKYGKEKGKFILEKSIITLDKKGYFNHTLSEGVDHDIYERYVERAIEATKVIQSHLKLLKADCERKEDAEESGVKNSFIIGGTYVDSWQIKDYAGQLESIMDGLARSVQSIKKNKDKDRG